MEKEPKDEPVSEPVSSHVEEDEPLAHKTPWIMSIFCGFDLNSKLAFAKVLLAAMRVLYVVGVYEEVEYRNAHRSASQQTSLPNSSNENAAFAEPSSGFRSSLLSPTFALLQTFLYHLFGLLPYQQSRQHLFLPLFLLARDFASYGSIPSLLLLSIDYPRRIVGIFRFLLLSMLYFILRFCIGGF
jgi:hypothetical protein